MRDHRTERVMLVVTVPDDHLHAVLDAMSAAGAGIIGHYTHCAFTSTGVGRFKPGPEAEPAVGEADGLNAVDEWRIETFCDRDDARAVVAALRAAHPYEEPVIYILPLLSEAEL